jgi:EAL domain-containing protein (putative c-di-GMP-specific phosphodiesterase class I)
VLETAIRQCKAWELDKLRMFILDVNVSAVQFADAQLADKIIRILTAHKYPAHKLCIEITESTQFTFTGPAMATFDKLRDAKISIALDDFGTGYSAFNKLKEMPVDIVKIERVFVADIENDSYLRYLFRAIAELVHTAGMRIVAEGVETQEQMNILLKNGADMLQGFLFAKPLSAEELSDKLNLFHETDLDSHMMLRQKIDITKLLKAEDSHILTPFLNRTMFRCIHILLHRENIDEAIQEVIGIAGWAVSVSRVYVFQLLEGHCFANTFEWCNLGTEPQKDNLQRLTLTESLRELIKRDGVIISSDIAELPPDLYDALNPQGIKSMALIPLWEKNTITGFIGFDECKEHRIWWPEEILMLYNISLIIASVMQRLIRQQEGCEAKG